MFIANIRGEKEKGEKREYQNRHGNVTEKGRALGGGKGGAKNDYDKASWRIRGYGRAERQKDKNGEGVE